MFVAFSAWLLRVPCVYTYYLAISVPTLKVLPNCPLSAKKSIFGDKMTSFGLISSVFLVFVRFFMYLCANFAQVGRNEELY